MNTVSFSTEETIQRGIHGALSNGAYSTYVSGEYRNPSKKVIQNTKRPQDEEIVRMLVVSYGDIDDLEFLGRAYTEKKDDGSNTMVFAPGEVEKMDLVGLPLYVEHCYPEGIKLPRKGMLDKRKYTVPGPSSVPLGRVIAQYHGVDPGSVWIRGKIDPNGMSPEEVKALRASLRDSLDQLSIAYGYTNTPGKLSSGFLYGGLLRLFDGTYARLMELSLTHMGDISGCDIGLVKASHNDSAEDTSYAERVSIITQPPFSSGPSQRQVSFIYNQPQEDIIQQSSVQYNYHAQEGEMAATSSPAVAAAALAPQSGSAGGGGGGGGSGVQSGGSSGVGPQVSQGGGNGNNSGGIGQNTIRLAVQQQQQLQPQQIPPPISSIQGGTGPAQPDGGARGNGSQEQQGRPMGSLSMAYGQTSLVDSAGQQNITNVATPQQQQQQQQPQSGMQGQQLQQQQQQMTGTGLQPQQQQQQQSGGIEPGMSSMLKDISEAMKNMGGLMGLQQQQLLRSQQTPTTTTTTGTPNPMQGSAQQQQQQPERMQVDQPMTTPQSTGASQPRQSPQQGQGTIQNPQTTATQNPIEAITAQFNELRRVFEESQRRMELYNVCGDYASLYGISKEEASKQLSLVPSEQAKFLIDNSTKAVATINQLRQQQQQTQAPPQQQQQLTPQQQAQRIAQMRQQQQQKAFEENMRKLDNVNAPVTTPTTAGLKRTDPPTNTFDQDDYTQKNPQMQRPRRAGDGVPRFDGEKTSYDITNMVNSTGPFSPAELEKLKKTAAQFPESHFGSDDRWAYDAATKLFNS